MQHVQLPESFAFPDKPYVLIKFGATWCGPCNRVKPQIESLLTRFQNVGYRDIDVDSEPQEHLNVFPVVKSLPTFFLARPTGPKAIVLLATVIGADIAAVQTMIQELCK